MELLKTYIVQELVVRPLQERGIDRDDRLQAAHLAAIASPIMVASCLAGFLVYGAIALRERPNLFQGLGLVCSLGGIALLALD